eukprot:CAMPEP_0181334634 /NCGR_PEP_ID=MMETSP1101-20121128/26377_1 /TAXON_ID=46948 /ORGANISM="Rhodomonas abbreviata, Strain Caron Lab Isolate" /LENGTH=65 /DNA_ID=CAMNT_0023444649 /DNA_START=219 /DNA_END=413 /DNA_ORIENTATION=+
MPCMEGSFVKFVGFAASYAADALTAKIAATFCPRKRSAGNAVTASAVNTMTAKGVATVATMTPAW